MKIKTAITIEENTFTGVRELAYEENRTVSNMIDTILLDYLNRKTTTAEAAPMGDK